MYLCFASTWRIVKLVESSRSREERSDLGPVIVVGAQFRALETPRHDSVNRRLMDVRKPEDLLDANYAVARRSREVGAMTRKTVEKVGGSRTLVVQVAEPPRVAVILLHGYAMRPEDLAPFAESMGVPGVFFLPEAPLTAEAEGRAWWPVDQERRANAMATGPRDLAEEHPPGAAAARTLVGQIINEVERRHAGCPLVLVGFSQGGMLALDTLLRDRRRVAGLALLSTSRISADEWAPLTGHLARLPILVSHGTRDPDLGFHAGEALRDMCIAGGAAVTWAPFEGQHEIPLVVWRALRKLLAGVISPLGARA